MKQKIRELIGQAVKAAYKQGELTSSDFPEVEIEVPKVEAHGDFSTNISMVMASIQKMAPRKIADAIINHINDQDNIIEKTEIAGPGFINFFITRQAWLPLLKNIHEKDTSYGASDIGKGKKIQVEYVSANPTGPLHVGHGRGAAVGDSLATILSFCGFDVTREYYVNDSGRQINTLGRSVYFRYREIYGQGIAFPEECYQGDYIRDLAKAVIEEKGEDLLHTEEADAVLYCARYAAKTILYGIDNDLESFGVTFDEWYSEQSLFDAGKVDINIEKLKEKNIIYKEDGAFWFKTTDFGDEKDRVVVRKNGLTTYFASDIAYHKDKFDRGFEKIVDVWGADHHGYIPRIQACIEASGYQPDQFKVILIQLVNLLRDGSPVAMSTRSGEFVTLEDVIKEVGRDAARFLFLMRHYESPLDFDLEVAKKKSNDNPVFYVQYVHARISSIARKADSEKGIRNISPDMLKANWAIEPEEIRLIKAMAAYPEVVGAAAEHMEPHRITFYLMDLAALFHSYYNKHKVLTDDDDSTLNRLNLVFAVKKVIRNGLGLIGVSAPEKM